MRKHTVIQVAACTLMLLLAALSAGAQNVINTVAGGGPNNLPTTNSAIGLPWAIAQYKNPSTGNVTTYISDNFTSRVFAVDHTGNLTVVAGNVVPGYRADGQAATIANLNAPEGVAVDSAGNLYIADTSNNVIRFVNTSQSTVKVYGTFSVAPGLIETIVGNGTNCAGAAPCGDGGAAAQAELSTPGGVWLDSSNNIYIADSGDDVIREVNAQTGIISTVAGSYMPCSAAPCGDGGAATSATLNGPGGVWLDDDNNIYIADTANDTIRVVNTQSSPITIANVTVQPGDIEAVAGSYAPCSVAPCGDGQAATSSELTQPGSVAGDSNGNLYIADTQDQVVRVVNTSGIISLLSGAYNTTCSQSPCGDGGAADDALLAHPQSVLVNGSSDLLIVDQSDDAVRELTAPVSASSTIKTVEGIITVPAFSGDGAPATDASLYSASGTTADAAGNIYIADAQNNAVRVVNTQSSSITIAGVSIAPGDIRTVAGTGSQCRTLPCGDGGPATAAQLTGPSSVALDARGNIYIADSLDSVIRVVNTQSSQITVAGVAIPPGDILTVAGDGQFGFGGDAGPATAATFNAPFAVALDASGNIYIADSNILTPGNGIESNNVIRVVNATAKQITVAGTPIGSGDINTVAGTQGSTCIPTDPCGDGGPATSGNAMLNGATSVAVDLSGNIYIADNLDNRIRFVDNATGIISTIAGTGAQCPQAPCGDGHAATTATLDSPFGVFVDYAGTVYVGDTDDSVVRAFTPGGDIKTVVGNYGFDFFGDGGAATSASLALPLGVGADAFGDLLVTDFSSQRVRSVSKLVATFPTAVPSPSPLSAPATLVSSTSKATLTITNDGNLTKLTVTEPMNISGTNASDFKETDNCNTPVPPGGGTCTVTVSFTPSAIGNRSATLKITDNASNSPQLVSLTGIGLSATTTTIKSSANPSIVNSAVTFTAMISPSGTGGTVTFNDGSTPLGSAVAVTNGVAAIQTSSLSAGTHSITAVYSGDDSAFLAGSTSAALQQVVSAGFQISPTTQSVAAGSSATFTISISKSSGFSGSVSLACTSGVPTGAACSFSPNPVTPGNSSTLTITTTAAAAALTSPAIGHRSAPLYAVWFLLPAMLLSTAGLTAPNRKKLIAYVLLTLAVTGLLFLVACGGGSSSSGGGGGSTATPAGTYTITVQGTSGSTSSTQTVTLTVQ